MTPPLNHNLAIAVAFKTLNHLHHLVGMLVSHYHTSLAKEWYVYNTGLTWWDNAGKVSFIILLLVSLSTVSSFLLVLFHLLQLLYHIISFHQQIINEGDTLPILVEA